MKIINLSHKIYSGMTTYPTDPDVDITAEKTIMKNNSLLHSIKIGTHTGTHLDAPSHILKDGKSVDCFGPEQFMGIAVRVDESSYEKLKELKYKIDGLIYDTNWYTNFDNPKLFFSSKRPKIPQDLVDTAVDLKLKFFGCDLPSVDASGAKHKVIHKALLKNDIIIYEALTNLNEIPLMKPFHFTGLPLLLEGLDGSPVRAIASFE